MVELKNVDGVIQQGFGGDTLNTAIYMSRLVKDKGVATSYLTGLGTDPYSQNMLAAWRLEGVNVSDVCTVANKQPGLYAIETDEDGERSFYYWRNDAAAKYWPRNYTISELTALISKYDWIYLSGISLAILAEDCLEMLLTALAECKKQGSLIAFDNNFRPALWENTRVAKEAYRKILSLTDIAFLTLDDEVQLWGDSDYNSVITRTRQLGVREIVIKRGSEPCLVVESDDHFEIPATLVDNVVDTTAAGDSFSAGYLAARLTGRAVVESAKAGHLLASQVIQKPGAIISELDMPII